MRQVGKSGVRDALILEGIDGDQTYRHGGKNDDERRKLG